MKKEIEAKILDIDKKDVRKNLKKLKFQMIHPERMMKRKAFYFESDSKNNRERWARVRDEGHRITLTVKEVKVRDDINGVFENEIVIDSFNEGVSLLKSLGMIEVAYQETYREEWFKHNEHVHIAIDTWPHLSPFVEIEAPEEDLVKFYVNELGFNFDKALFGGVDVVYKKIYNIEREVICKAPRIAFDMSLEEILSLV